MRRLAFTVLALLAACDSPRERAGDEPAVGMPMSADSMQMNAMEMLPAYREHLDSLEDMAAAADSMPRGMMMDVHARETREFVDAASGDLMRLGMHSDAAYEALADSVVEDLSRIQAASGNEAERLLRAHLERVRRLMSAYEGKTREAL